MDPDPGGPKTYGSGSATRVSSHFYFYLQEVEAELTKAGASADQIKQIGPHKAFLGNR
jgi:hypothetical protein